MDPILITVIIVAIACGVVAFGTWLESQSKKRAEQAGIYRGVSSFDSYQPQPTTPPRPTASDLAAVHGLVGVSRTPPPLVRVIPLTQDKQAYVDAADADRLKQHKWIAHKTGKKVVAARYVTENGKRRLELMHREIADQLRPDLRGKRYIVRHKDDNGLNNRRDNIDVLG